MHIYVKLVIVLQHFISDVKVTNLHESFVFNCKHVLIRNVCYSLRSLPKRLPFPESS